MIWLQGEKEQWTHMQWLFTPLLKAFVWHFHFYFISYRKSHSAVDSGVEKNNLLWYMLWMYVCMYWVHMCSMHGTCVLAHLGFRGWCLVLSSISPTLQSESGSPLHPELTDLVNLASKLAPGSLILVPEHWDCRWPWCPPNFLYECLGSELWSSSFNSKSFPQMPKTILSQEDAVTVWSR